MLATQAFVSQCLNATLERRERIAKLLADVDRRARQGRGDVVLRGHIGPHDDKITVKGFVEEEKDGKQVATDEPRDYEVEDCCEVGSRLERPLAERVPAFDRVQRSAARICSGTAFEWSNFARTSSWKWKPVASVR